MHDHHGTGADGTARLNLLPLWLQVLWAVVMGAVVAHQLIAFGSGRGLDRAWSAAHAILATGMLYMFLPWATAPLRPAVLIGAYCALLVVTLIALSARWIITGSVPLMGVLVAIDFSAMAYMTADSNIAAITCALIAYYGVCAAAWTRARVPRAGQALMAAAMAYMFLATAWAKGVFEDVPSVSNGAQYGTFGALLVTGVLAYSVVGAKLVRRPVRA